MKSPCRECGYVEEDYATTADRRWLQAAARDRVSRCFEGLSDEALSAFPEQDTMRDEIDKHVVSGDIHRIVHELSELSRATARLDPPTVRAGRVVQISSSDGGVPKRAVERAEVHRRGLVGDRQESLRHHGHAWQALCLWSAERIEALRGEGHPVSYGSAGENLTLGGLEWDEMRSGLHLRIGSVVCELTGPTTPCNKNAESFSRRHYRRMDHDRHPGWSRWYASVLEEGAVSKDDPVTIL